MQFGQGDKFEKRVLVQQETRAFKAKTEAAPHFRPLEPWDKRIAEHINDPWVPVETSIPDDPSKDPIPAEEPSIAPGSMEATWREYQLAHAAQFKLREFDAPAYRTSRNLLVWLVGHRGAGKTHMMKWLAYWWYRDNFSRIAIFCYTNKLTHSWDGIAPKSYIFRDMSQLGTIMKIQEKIVESAYGNAIAIVDPQKDERPMPLILDDEGINGNLRAAALSEIAVLGRHTQMHCMLSTQWYSQTNPTIRDQADVTIVFEQKSPAAVDALYETFGRMFKTRRALEAYLDANTLGEEKGNAMVIVSRKIHGSIYEDVFHLRCPKDEPPPFRVGSDAFWKTAEQMEQYAGQMPSLMGAPLSRASLDSMIAGMRGLRV